MTKIFILMFLYLGDAFQVSVAHINNNSRIDST